MSKLALRVSLSFIGLDRNEVTRKAECFTVSSREVFKNSFAPVLSRNEAARLKLALRSASAPIEPGRSTTDLCHDVSPVSR